LSDEEVLRERVDSAARAALAARAPFEVRAAFAGRVVFGGRVTFGGCGDVAVGGAVSGYVIFG